MNKKKQYTSNEAYCFFRILNIRSADYTGMEQKLLHF